MRDWFEEYFVCIDSLLKFLKHPAVLITIPLVLLTILIDMLAYFLEWFTGILWSFSEWLYNDVAFRIRWPQNRRM